MIQVTKPFLPPIEEYISLLESIWKNNILTNNGPLVKELESQLLSTLGVNHISFLSNGTITLQIALKILQSKSKSKSKIITTPFSYIATASSIQWEGLTPIFIDIDPNTFNADYTKLSLANLSEIAGVVITHCFGVPCDIENWEHFSNNTGIPIIYDAAHAFGVKYKSQSLLNYGFASSLSFHATKLFHTVEGGALVTNNSETLDEINFLKNFGHDGPYKFSRTGINGKNSEFHAAMGLINLRYLDSIFASRKSQYNHYKTSLIEASLPIQFQEIPSNTEYNYSYFPILFKDESTTIKVIDALNSSNIFPRRYFYPSLPSTGVFDPTFKTPIADSISERIICLPLFHTLTKIDQDNIINIVSSALK